MLYRGCATWNIYDIMQLDVLRMPFNASISTTVCYEAKHLLVRLVITAKLPMYCLAYSNIGSVVVCITQSVLDTRRLLATYEFERGNQYTAVQSECEKHC